MAFKDPEARRAYAREWQRNWRKANPEKSRALNAKYAAKDPERAKARFTRYNEKNKEARNADSLQRWHANHERYRRLKYDVSNFRQISERCESCGDKFPNTKKACFDHDHFTGEFRGWLCNGCNLALGLLKDDPHRIEGLLEYLRKHNDPNV